MSKKSEKSFSKALSRKVVAVWLIQNQKRFLLNYFNSFEMAERYINAFKHLKINGEVLMGELPLKDLIKK